MSHNWSKCVKGLLRAEMARKQIKYDELVELLEELGVKETAPNLRNKISRGSFTAIFMIQCLTAMKCTQISLEEPK